ncbi:MAG: gliding motility-associated C-terminal domain-containing protein [Bacteroidetes bacterium]|nr:gliding motility-associated C-terminal domain-containing protein [Bacteroidota bacterium]
MKKLSAFFLLFILISFIKAQSPPSAINDTAIVPQSSDNILSVAQNDTNYAGGALTLNLVTLPSRGTASIINSVQIRYVPTPLYFGLDSFQYAICDTNNLCDTASVFIIIIGSNAVPKGWEDEFIIAEGQDTTELAVLANDTDAEGDSLFVRSVYSTSFDPDLGEIIFDSITGVIRFVRVPLSCGNSKFYYLVCDQSGCDTGQATIYIYCPGEVFSPEGFSPNGDGKNDLLVFTDLEYFSPASLKVFNRYGSIVYESTDYKNDWDGNTMSTGRPIPDGTYFYILELVDKRKSHSYLIINR